MGILEHPRQGQITEVSDGNEMRLYYHSRLQNGVQSIKKNGFHQLRTSDNSVSLKVFGNAETNNIASLVRDVPAAVGRADVPGVASFIPGRWMKNW